MVARAHRTMNLKQLATLAEVYWDDPLKLAEILDALRSRFEPEAEAVAQTVEHRVAALRRPGAKSEPPPRLLRDPDDPDSHSAAAPVPSHRATLRPARWRWPAAALILVLIGVGAWFLWPRSAPPVPAAETEAGPEIAEAGAPQPTPEKEPSGALSVAPTGPKRGTPIPPPPVAHEDHARAAPVVREAPEPRTPRQPREVAMREPRALAETQEAGAPTRPSAAARPREASPARAPAAANAPAARAAQPSGLPTAASAANDAQLECFLTDNRPPSCGGGGGSSSSSAARNRERRKPAPAPGGGAPDAPAASAAHEPASSSTASAAAPSATHTGATSPASSASGSGSGGSGGGGGAASASGGGAEQPEGTPRGRPSRTAAAGGAVPPQDADKPDGQQVADAPLSCPSAPRSGRVVFILDGSVSMGLPLDVDAALEDDLDRRILQHDQDARQQYRALLAEPGLKRMSRAQDAFAEAAADVPAGVELGLVVFQECRDIRRVGVFEAARRGTAVDYVRNLVPHGRTPLADSLRAAGAMLGDGKSSIVLLTDGREFCSGDPCAAAAELKAAHPGTPVHVIDITGQAKAECIPAITGGRSYKPESSEDLGRILRNAFRGAEGKCGPEITAER